ncbi:MAG TPA: beta-galactosidase [Planctomycetota bacterium]|nr:beta-galactosidase [Planctomycetota bacterium]
MLKHIAVAYYPEDWQDTPWPEDLRLMKANRIGVVRILEFAWSRMERGDGEWTFDWVHGFMQLG